MADGQTKPVLQHQLILWQMTKLNLFIQAGRVMREACIQRAIQAGVVTRVQFANAGRSDYKFRKVSRERERER